MLTGNWVSGITSALKFTSGLVFFWSVFILFTPYGIFCLLVFNTNATQMWHVFSYAYSANKHCSTFLYLCLLLNDVIYSQTMSYSQIPPVRIYNPEILVFLQLQPGLKEPNCGRARLFFKKWQRCHFLLLAASAGLLPCRSKVYRTLKLKGKLMWFFLTESLCCTLCFRVVLTPESTFFNDWFIDWFNCQNREINKTWNCFLNQIQFFFFFVSPIFCH